MRPTKVNFIKKPKLEPQTEYKRVWWLLWLIPISFPKYKLLGNMVFDVCFSDGSIHRITVLKGYICDLASIPRLFWMFYTPDGTYRYIAVAHDIIYQSELYIRIVADKIFKLGLTLLPNQVKKLFHKSVRVGGYFVWKSHTEKSKSEAMKFLNVEILQEGEIA